MCSKDNLVDLGFTEARLPAGTHLCQIYSDDNERDSSLLQFLLRGIQSGECNACFSENISKETLAEYFSEHGVSLTEAESSGAFSLSPTREVYFENNRFDPERMLKLLTAFYESSVEGGYSGARVIGEMSSEVEHIEGGSRLLEYESRVCMLLRDHPLTAVCQYNAHEFEGSTIMDVLKVHPMMIVRGLVVHNPFFIPPEEFLDLKEKS